MGMYDYTKKGLIADTIHGNIFLSDFEKKILSHVVFNRLHDVYQNSTAYLTYPCNRTKRFEHSLGTMNLCGDMFAESVINSNKKILEEFFSEFKKNLEGITEEICEKRCQQYQHKLGGKVNNISGKIPDTKDLSYLHKNCPRNVGEYTDVYVILLEAIRIAGLLHDIGHPPYSHVTETALTNVKINLEETECNNSRAQEFKKIMTNFFQDSTKPLHEKMGDRISDVILMDSIIDITNVDDAYKEDVINNQLFQILVKETVSNIFLEKGDFKALHCLISGTIDGDRLDYVTRDSINSGINNGKTEYCRLFSGISIVKYESDNKKEYLFSPNIKSLSTVEDFLERRWGIYKNIVLHHRVVKTDQLLQRAIEAISEDYLNGKIGKDNEENGELLPFDISGLWKPLKVSAFGDFKSAISQWDDSWLMTVLKKHYFTDYIKKRESTDERYILLRQLEELLTNTKHYFSVIKRMEDFLIIDLEIIEVLKERRETVQNSIKKLEELSENKSKLGQKVESLNVEQTAESKKILIDIEQFLIDIQKLFSFIHPQENEYNYNGLVFCQLRKVYNTHFSNIGDISSFVSDIVEETSKKSFVNDEIDDIMCVTKKYNIGISKPLYFHEKNNDLPLNLRNVSSIANILEQSYNTFPQFFIYILKNKKSNKDLDTTSFLKDVGKNLGNRFVEICEKKLNGLKNPDETAEAV